MGWLLCTEEPIEIVPKAIWFAITSQLADKIKVIYEFRDGCLILNRWHQIYNSGRASRHRGTADHGIAIDEDFDLFVGKLALAGDYGSAVLVAIIRYLWRDPSLRRILYRWGGSHRDDMESVHGFRVLCPWQSGHRHRSGTWCILAGAKVSGDLWRAGPAIILSR